MLDKDIVQYYYDNKYWNEMFVHIAVECDIITKEDYQEIVGKEYTEDE